jgi:hypothetical protein
VGPGQGEDRAEGELRRGVGVVTSTDRAVEQTCRELVHEPGPSGQGECDGCRSIDPHRAPRPSGVQLARLIALAGLTPAQALEIGAGLLTAVTRLSEPDTLGIDDEVVIGLDGRVALGCASGGRAARSSARRPSSAMVEAVLAELVVAVRRRTRPGDPLLVELERAIALVSLADLPVVARTLEDACAAIDRDDIRAELSALVRAIAGHSGTTIVSGAPPGAPSAVAADRGRAPERRPSGRGRVVIRRIGAWLLSVAVLVTIVLLEFAFLRDDIVTDVDLLLDAGRSESVPSVAPEPEGLPVVAPAPATAGTVTAVDLRALDRCTPGAACSMRVLVRLVPEAEPRTVTWSIQIVDRCTGATATVPGGAIVIAPGEEQATVVSPVPIPHAASAVFAVTERPAVAAGPPVLVGSCPPTGPVG